MLEKNQSKSTTRSFNKRFIPGKKDNIKIAAMGALGEHKVKQERKKKHHDFAKIYNLNVEENEGREQNTEKISKENE